MKKEMRVFCMILCLMTVSVAGIQAQTGSNPIKKERNSFWSNWFVSAGGGAQIFFGDGDSQGRFSGRIAPALDISVGKWFTPELGLRLGYSGLQARGYSSSPGAYTTGNTDGLYSQKWNIGYFHGDVLLNASNLLCGYNETRIYNAIPYVGFGAMQSWDTPKTGEFAATVGLINRFRILPVLDINLEVRASMMNDRFDGELGGNDKEGMAAITVGVTYRFK